jgi:flagellar basal body rod protein FlgG
MQLNSISSAIYSGLNGVNKAQNGVAEAADNISKLNAERDQVANTSLPQEAVDENAPLNTALDARPQAVDLSAEAVNLIVNEHLNNASVKVIKTADEMLGTLIDTKA